MADKITHLQSDERKTNRKMWYCDMCEKEITFKTKSKHKSSKPQIHKKGSWLKDEINNPGINEHYYKLRDVIKDCWEKFSNVGIKM